MKKSLIIAITVLSLIFAANTMAATITLNWQPNTESDLQGYNLYYGTSSRQYGLPIPVGNVTSWSEDFFEEGETYYFTLTAVDNAGNESGYSAEIEVTAPGGASEPEPLATVYPSNPFFIYIYFNLVDEAEVYTMFYSTDPNNVLGGTAVVWNGVKNTAGAPQFTCPPIMQAGPLYVAVIASNSQGASSEPAIITTP